MTDLRRFKVEDFLEGSSGPAVGAASGSEIQSSFRTQALFPSLGGGLDD